MAKAPLLPFKIPSPSSSPSPYGRHSSPSSPSNFTPRRLFPALSLLTLTILLLTTASWHFSGSAASRSSVMAYWRGGSLADEGVGSSATSSSSGSTKTGGKDPWQQASEALDVGASLEERLAAWESSPRDEPANWVSKNIKVRAHCLHTHRTRKGFGQRRAYVANFLNLSLHRHVPTTASDQIKTSRCTRIATCSGPR